MKSRQFRQVGHCSVAVKIGRYRVQSRNDSSERTTGRLGSLLQTARYLRCCILGAARQCCCAAVPLAVPLAVPVVAVYRYCKLRRGRPCTGGGGHATAAYAPIKLPKQRIRSSVPRTGRLLPRTFYSNTLQSPQKPSDGSYGRRCWCALTRVFSSCSGRQA
jgi:hypothetical protein